MKPYYFHILCFLLIISCIFAFIVANCSKSGVPKIQSLVLNGENLEPLGGGSTSRALLSLNAKQDIYLVASLDGTIYSVESNSGKVLWSFSSGSSIYSSYQALAGDTSDKENPSGLDGGTKAHLKHSYIDVGHDCNWVWKGPNNTAQMELPMAPEEFVSYAPYMLDEQVILGSMKTTVFVLDAKNGRRVFTHTLHESRPNAELEDDVDFGNLVESTAVNWKPVELINVIRKDFFVQSTDPKSGDVLWNLTSAEFSYAYHLRGPGTNEFGLEYKGDFKMPLLYQKGALVTRIPNHYGAIGLEYKGDSNVPLLYQKGAIAARIPNHYGAKDFFQMHGGEMVLRQGERALPGPTSNVNMPNEYKDPHYSSWWKAKLSWTTILGSLGLIAIFLLRRLSWSNNLSEKKTAVSKRKKARRLGNNKNNANFEKNNKIIFFEEKGKTNDLQFVEKNENEPLLDLTKSINGVSAGRKIGKLFVSNIEIAKGSNGTVVLEGNYEGRPVAIKRLVKAHHDVAFKEIQNLIASDRHPNIVRWYGVEYDSDFVYLSLERCMCSLNELIEICSASSQSSVFVEDQSANSINEYNVRLDSVQGIDKDIELWKTNGYPSPSLLKMMRDVVSGLAHLHELGIIHRDLKPQNVLILKQRSLSAKLSDMGISKRLIGDMSSLGHHATGSGSSGWQAPEQLLHGRQTRAVDLFSLGCVLFFCITGGKHPFGDRLERDINIVKNRVDLFMVEHIPEAVDLLSHLLDSDPELRPKALDVLRHPLFWNSEMRLSFLRDTSDRVELEDRENESDLLKALEAVSPVALGGKWDEKMETVFIANIGRYRRYKFDSTRDLLRVIRNKLNHYRELPKEIQDILGSVPEGFDGYFASRFPRFLIQVYKVMYKYCREEECFWKYFKDNLS